MMVGGVSKSLPEWVIESIPIKVNDSLRGDDHVALIKISKGAYSVGYISDAGYAVFKELRDSQINFSCDVLVAGEHSHGEGAISDFLTYTGASEVIFGRSYFYTPKKRAIGVISYDQRFCGAVRIRLREDRLETFSKP